MVSLPLHPLLVHLPVVSLPLAAIGMIFLTVQPKARRRLSIPLLVVLVVGFATAFLAAETGESLAPYVGGAPRDHAELGGWLVWAAGLFTVVGGGWLLWVRRDVRVAGRRDELASRKMLIGLVASMLGLGVLALTVLVGHSGARSVWEEVVNPPEPTAPGEGVTMLEVSRHNTDADCWVAIDGNAYDLTGWLPNHPGGPSKVGRICGTDATDQFARQHAEQERPNQTLEHYLIGSIVG